MPEKADAELQACSVEIIGPRPSTMDRERRCEIERKLHYRCPSPHALHPVCECSPSRGGDVAVYILDINQASLPISFHSVLVSVSVSMALSTVLHAINSPEKSPLSYSVLLVLFLPYWSFQLYISL